MINATLKFRSPLSACVAFSAAAMILAAALYGIPTASAAQGDCGQPVSGGAAPVATDCLFILNAAVGLATCNPECICELNNVPPISSTDALVCLNVAIGNPPPGFPMCPCGSSTTTTSSSTSSSSSSSTSTTVSTTSTTSSTTTTTMSSTTGCLSAQAPACDGLCPPQSACVQGIDGCSCQPLGCGGYMGPPMCFGLCDPGFACANLDETCICQPFEFSCGSGSAPQCDGVCPTNSFCGDAGGTCQCFQVGCGQFRPFPICGGVCPPDQICVDTGSDCGCVAAVQ